MPVHPDAPVQVRDEPSRRGSLQGYSLPFPRQSDQLAAAFVAPEQRFPKSCFVGSIPIVAFATRSSRELSSCPGVQRDPRPYESMAHVPLTQGTKGSLTSADFDSSPTASRRQTARSRAGAKCDPLLNKERITDGSPTPSVLPVNGFSQLLPT